MPASNYPENQVPAIVELISTQGYAIAEHFLAPPSIQALVTRAKQLQNLGLMHKAKTGLAKNKGNSTSLRGDFIHWIENSDASEAELTYLNAMHVLQTAINQEFFLGLFELESHFAIYPPGAGYQKHLDQFIGREERKVSCILYLNEEWDQEDGGELRIYLDKEDESKFTDITPQAGKLVVFLSRDFPHEVLPARRERMSITGWFRSRDLNN